MKQNFQCVCVPYGVSFYFILFFYFVGFVPILFVKRKMMWGSIGGELGNNWEGMGDGTVINIWAFKQTLT